MESMSPTTSDGIMPNLERKSQPESHAITVVSGACKKPLTTSAASTCKGPPVTMTKRIS